MRESPRVRRLRSDFKAVEQLQSESTIFSFEAKGSPPHMYVVRFRGTGLWRPGGTSDVLVRYEHEAAIELGAAYPRMMPALGWRTPIFHPNISASGVVCLGGYATHWVPSVNLDELCNMLWDMVRYENFDVESPYNRDAALWARSQKRYVLPVDPRPLRDKVLMARSSEPAPRGDSMGPPPVRDEPVTFLDAARESGEVVDAEVVEGEGPDILFIE